MSSEKVKEIKNNIIICSNKIECKGCSLFPNMKSTNCRNKLLADALTLINEFESENAKLTSAVVGNLDAYRDGFTDGANLNNKVENKWKEENQQLKDRIAELEKENDELKVDLKNSIDMQEQMLDGFKTATKEVEENLASEIPDLLKQFAER